MTAPTIDPVWGPLEAHRPSAHCLCDQCHWAQDERRRQAEREAERRKLDTGHRPMNPVRYRSPSGTRHPAGRSRASVKGPQAASLRPLVFAGR